MKLKAFSLLELMVTVAVIGLITGVAIVNYKDYLIRSRIATAFDIMKHYSHLGQEYYEAYGEFGNAQAIGLTVGAEDYLVANPQSINPYTTVQVVDVDATAKCYNNIRFTFSAAALGTEQNFDIQMLIRIKNGRYIISCGIPWDQTEVAYANVINYFPATCRDQNVNTCNL